MSLYVEKVWRTNERPDEQTNLCIELHFAQLIIACGANGSSFREFQDTLYRIPWISFVVFYSWFKTDIQSTDRSPQAHQVLSFAMCNCNHCRIGRTNRVTRRCSELMTKKKILVASWADSRVCSCSAASRHNNTPLSLLIPTNCSCS